jgi:hypothetical protein
VRKAGHNNLGHIAVRMTPEQEAWVIAQARGLDISRAEFIRRLVDRERCKESPYLHG